MLGAINVERRCKPWSKLQMPLCAAISSRELCCEDAIHFHTIRACSSWECLLAASASVQASARLAHSHKEAPCTGGSKQQVASDS
jgi:hypothetical protein